MFLGLLIVIQDTTMTVDEDLMITGLAYYHVNLTLDSGNYRNITAEEVTSMVNHYKIELEHELEVGDLDPINFYKTLQIRYGVKNV